MHRTPREWVPQTLLTSPICGTTSRGINPVYYVLWLQWTIPTAIPASSMAQKTHPIFGSTANVPIERQFFYKDTRFLD